MSHTAVDQPISWHNSALTELLMNYASLCSRCGICVAECHYLTKHGYPGALAQSYDPDHPDQLVRAFECTLCGLCAHLCPENVDPALMSLEMRREAFSRGLNDLPEHRGLRKYERIGNSRAFSWYALPDGCDTIFFPGCTLAGSRAETTDKLFSHLQQKIPDIGIVLDCCNKPSHDLGDNVHFSHMFFEMYTYLSEQNIKNLLVACPNCLKIFNTYAPGLTTRTVYEVLTEIPPDIRKINTDLVVHDPCVIRHNKETQTAVRALLERTGSRLIEMIHTKDQTICCGAGGGANSMAPDLAEKWIDQRLEEAQGRPIVSYCAGCTSSYSSKATAGHILDLLFEPQTALTPKHRVTKAPFTYLNRLKFKKKLQRQFPATVTRERTAVPPTAKKATPVIVRLAVAVVLAVTVLAAGLAGR